MKTTKPPKREVVSPTDTELQEVAARLAIKRGLALPKTEQDVANYEQAFADLLTRAALPAPRPLQEVLEKAAAFEADSRATLTPKLPTEAGLSFGLAARNGQGGQLSDETLRIMEEALREANEDD